MIDIMFDKGGGKALVRIQNTQVQFARVMGGHLLWNRIEKAITVQGVLKEFPELSDKPNNEVLEIGKQRFIDHIKSLKSETQIKDYIMDELMKHGCKPLYTQRQGHRVQRCH